MQNKYACMYESLWYFIHSVVCLLAEGQGFGRCVCREKENRSCCYHMLSRRGRIIFASLLKYSDVTGSSEHLAGKGGNFTLPL